MLALFLSFALSTNAIASVDKLAPYRDLVVLRVDIDAPPSEKLSELRPLIELQPGYLLSPELLQSSIKRLYALGRFSDVRVYAERISGVVQLRFVLIPQSRIVDLEFKNVHHVKVAELRESLNLPLNSVIDTQTEQRVKASALAFLNLAGFPHASVATQRIVLDEEKGHERLRIFVHEGEPLKVTRIQIDGMPHVPAYVLMPLLKTKVGRIADERRAVSDRLMLLAAYRQRGFRAVQIKPPVLSREGDGVVVTFTVEAGHRMHLDFVGQRLLTADELRAMWPNSDGSYAKGDLYAFMQRIRSHYQRLGYNNASIELRGFRDTEAHVDRYLFQIDEGQPLRVVRWEFPGAQKFSQKILTQQVKALLRRNLQGENAVRRLHGRMPERIPADQRWVPDLYDEAIEEIQAAYHNLGFLSVQVARTEATIENNLVSVRVTISEGPQTFVRSLSFRGNVDLEASELLRVAEHRSALHTAVQDDAQGDSSHAHDDDEETPSQSFLGTPFSHAAVEDTRIALLRAYRDHGYLFAQVTSAVQLERQDDDTQDGVGTVRKIDADVAYTIVEGPQVRVKSILIRGNRFTRTGIIKSHITLQPNDIYRLEQAVEDQRSIASLGVFSSVRVKLIDEERKEELKDLVAEVTERNRQPIEVVPGISSADGPRLRLSYSHINVAGTASTFTSSIKVNRQVFFSLYGDYADRMRKRFAEYKETAELTKAIERELRFGIYSPQLKGLPLDPRLRIDFINERENAIPYSLDTIAIIFGLDFFATPRLKASIEPQVSVSNLECDKSEPQPNCRDQARGRNRFSIDTGLRRTFKIGPVVSWDRRDNPLNPSRGFMLQGKAAYALGESRETPAAQFSDLYRASFDQPFAFVKAEAGATGYIPLLKTTLALSVRGGTIYDIRKRCAPVDERFYLGGRSTLRGYIERTLIPSDADVVDSASSTLTCLESTQSIEMSADSPPVTKGGNHFIMLKGEFRVPVTENIAFVTFLDAGNLWVTRVTASNFKLRLGTGAGLRYNTPVGAISFDLGLNPNPRSFSVTDINGNVTSSFREATWQVHFSVGAF